MAMAFLTQDQLIAVGFKSVGKGVLLSEKASIYNPGAISVGDHTRIDDFCILSAGTGGIALGRYVHISCYCSLIGQGRIVMEDFSGISSRVSIYSSTDDFSGASMTNSTVPNKFKNVKSGDVILRKHVVVGCGSVIMPRVELGEGVALGALTFANRNCEAFSIYAGHPARKIGQRKRDMLECEQVFTRECGLVE